MQNSESLWVFWNKKSYDALFIIEIHANLTRKVWWTTYPSSSAPFIFVCNKATVFSVEESFFSTPEDARQVCSSVKIMLIVYFNFQRTMCHKFFPTGMHCDPVILLRCCAASMETCAAKTSQEVSQWIVVLCFMVITHKPMFHHLWWPLKWVVYFWWFSWRSWNALTQFSFCILVNRPGMNFGALCHIFKAWVKIFSHDASLVSGQVSVVGIQTCCGLDSLGFEPRWGQKFPDLSRPVLWPNLVYNG